MEQWGNATDRSTVKANDVEQNQTWFNVDQKQTLINCYDRAVEQ